jgi:DNA mismatch endonuclease (patch repair protein)
MKNDRPLPLDEKTSFKLSKVKQANTSTELKVRSCLHKLGFRFRIRNKGLPGSPDIANRRKKWAIFINGCFWHHHEGCKLATLPKNNKEFWLAKFKRNKERDIDVVNKLRSMGFNVLTVWQCETNNGYMLSLKLTSFLSGHH